MAKRKVCAITTVDNPYDPFDDFTHWFMFDMLNGYNSCGILARISKPIDSYTDEEMFDCTSEAIDEMISFDLRGKWKKVVREIDEEEYKTG